MRVDVSPTTSRLVAPIFERKGSMTFHAVNGDRPGMVRETNGTHETPQTHPQVANRGDRGDSDRLEPRIFLIGRPLTEQPRPA